MAAHFSSHGIRCGFLLFNNETPGVVVGVEAAVGSGELQHTGGNRIAQVSHQCREIIQRDLPADMRD